MSRIPSYLEAFNKGLSDRDKIRGFVLDLVSAGVIPEVYDTGFLGIAINVRDRFLEFLNKASDDQLKKAVALAEKRFA